ncbi:MAG TPA: PAS domain-containing sensor histidine kinase [Candidatus Acidoferrum sp.]|nr:PAS domain-containing sensor histidine kinase [Candidatus Acidoferrum sp.]
MEFSSIYSEENRKRLLIAAAVLIVAIAVVDWQTKPFISIGFLYLFPILLVAGFLPRWQITLIALVCAVLQELFSELPSNEAVTRLLMASAGFVGTGLFASEIIRNRQVTLEHLKEVETQIELRKEVEEQLQVLVESSPVAIVTIDSMGSILLANEASQSLLAPGSTPIVGQPISEFLPALQAAVQTKRSRQFRTELRCRGKRKNGEAFLAAVWFSTYTTARGPRLAAIIVDLSEDLRDREDLSLDHLLKNTTILMSAIAHEIRNLSGAVLIVHKNLSRLPDLQNNEDFRALGTLIEGLGKLSAMELKPAADQHLDAVELSSVLDELRILMEPSYREAGIEVIWRVHEDLPLVTGDRYGLAQVFLNLSLNSHRAMETTDRKQLMISSAVEGDSVVLRFEDTGVGIPSPDGLFKPFQQGADSTGLGLYVSRAILRSFGGELIFEPRTEGCCFAVRLTRALNREDSSDE